MKQKILFLCNLVFCTILMSYNASAYNNPEEHEALSVEANDETSIDYVSLSKRLTNIDKKLDIIIRELTKIQKNCEQFGIDKSMDHQHENAQTIKKEEHKGQGSAVASDKEVHNKSPEKNINTESKTESKNTNAEKEEYDVALSSLKEGAFEESKKLFDSFIKKHTTSLLLPNAYFWYAESYFKVTDYNEAAINYVKAYKQDPHGKKAADSLLKAAIALEKLNRETEACKMLSRLDKEFKDKSSSLKQSIEEIKARVQCAK